MRVAVAGIWPASWPGCQPRRWVGVRWRDKPERRVEVHQRSRM